MTCYSCIEKMARKLIEHHRRELDLIRALELAEKAVTRVESRPKRWWQKTPPFFGEAAIFLGALHGIFGKVRTCSSCFEKAFQKYKAHNLSDAEAKFMAKKLMARIEKRKKKEHIRAGYKNIDHLLWRWTLLCNWKATFFWSFKELGLHWIGKGFNPDYNQACTGSGTPACLTSLDPCGSRLNCCACVNTGCGCPVALANSSLFLKLCTSTASGGTAAGCDCNLGPGECFDGRAPNHTCSACANVCQYNCNAGFRWNGVACVPQAWFDGLAGPI